jgi:hypothetical protein
MGKVIISVARRIQENENICVFKISITNLLPITMYSYQWTSQEFRLLICYISFGSQITATPVTILKQRFFLAVERSGNIYHDENFVPLEGNKLFTYSLHLTKPACYFHFCEWNKTLMVGSSIKLVYQVWVGGWGAQISPIGLKKGVIFSTGWTAYPAWCRSRTETCHLWKPGGINGR